MCLYWNDNPALVQPMADAVQRNNLGGAPIPVDSVECGEWVGGIVSG